jgi:acetyl esterase/lipase
MRMIRLSLLAFLVAITACSSTTGARHVEASFYLVPKPLPPGRPGQLIRTVRVPSSAGSRAWAILYHSRSAQGRDTAESGFLVAPDTPSPAGGYPLVSWAHGTTGLADACAPSRSTFEGSLLHDQIVLSLIHQGFVVVATDYEGLGVGTSHTYLLGQIEGHSVLDAARAARAFPGIRTSNRISVFGYSQGGHAALWAGQLASAYAPDLDVTGVVAAAPVGDLARIANLWAGPGGPQPYLLMALDSWSSSYGVPLEPILTPKGRDARLQVGQRCIGQLDWKAFGSGLFRRASPAWRSWLNLARANTPGQTALGAPVLVQQGDADTLIPIDTTVALVHALCSHGTRAELLVYAGADHDVLTPGLGDALSWMREASLGAPEEGSCSV